MQTVKLNTSNFVVDKILHLVKVLNENDIPVDSIAYKISEEDAAALADEIIPTMPCNIDRLLLEKAAAGGYAHRRLKGGSYMGVLLV